MLRTANANERSEGWVFKLEFYQSAQADFVCIAPEFHSEGMMLCAAIRAIAFIVAE